MKHANWAWWTTKPAPKCFYLPMGLFGAALLAVLLWVLVAPVADGVPPFRFDEVDQCSEAPVSGAYDRAGLAAMLQRPFEVAPACWQAITLPTRRPAAATTFSTGTQLLTRTWFRLRYVVPENWMAGDALMVYVPRVMGTVWQVRVDGLIQADNLDDWRMTWNRPLEVRLEREHFRAGQTHEIVVGVVHIDEMGFAMSRIIVGPAGTVGRLLTWRQYLQITMPQAASAVTLLLGAFFLSFWLARRADRAYLLLAFTSVVWSVCNLQYVLPRWDDPQLDAWYVALVHQIPVPWMNWLIYLFAASFASRHLRWLEWLLPLYVLGVSLMSLPLWWADRNIELLVVTAYTLFGIASIVVICWLAVVSRSVELRVIAVVLFLAAFAGANDLALSAQFVDPENLFLVPYCGILLFGSFLYAVQRRYVSAINGHEQLSVDLTHRLAEREEELTQKHLRLRELERAQTLATERQRLMRDMHDGLGSALTSSLAVVERGEVQPKALAGMLRECVDDMRAVIDSLEPMDHDIAALLAMLRFRLGQRLELAGIRLEWNMPDLPSLVWMGPTEALQVMRIAQESLANVIKHAKARCVQITASQLDDQVEVRISDDGIGFDTSVASLGRGLRILKQRSATLGGSLAIESKVGGGTTVRLRLDVHRQLG